MLIKNIFKDALALSEFEKNYKPRKYTFIQRNRIIIALSDFVIIPEGELNSGTNRSVEWAKEFNKEIFVIPHRLNESSLTRYLAKENLAKVIWDIDEFIANLGIDEKVKVMDLQEALKIYGDKLYEMELNQEVEIKNAKVYFTSI
jgi:DNA processing protein